MSKGWGRNERFWFDLACNYYTEFDASGGWTFSKVCAAIWPNLTQYEIRLLKAGRLRALRRALQGLVRNRIILDIGGPSSPKRAYLINPHVLSEDDPLRAQILAGLAEQGVTVSNCGHFVALPPTTAAPPGTGNHPHHEETT